HVHGLQYHFFQFDTMDKGASSNTKPRPSPLYREFLEEAFRELIRSSCDKRKIDATNRQDANTSKTLQRRVHLSDVNDAFVELTCESVNPGNRNFSEMLENSDELVHRFEEQISSSVSHRESALKERKAVRLARNKMATRISVATDKANQLCPTASEVDRMVFVACSLHLTEPENSPSHSAAQCQQIMDDFKLCRKHGN
ncbi:hypothetical protein PENTCL1PPCAC_20157, partial [Pristionchus entomophagus]